MRKSAAPKTARSVQPAETPASETRPIVRDERPAPRPVDAIRMGELADKYAEIRERAEALKDALAPVAIELLGLMTSCDRKNVVTARGLITRVAAGADGETLDADEAVRLLKSAGIAPPMKPRKGSPARLEFRRGK